MTRKKPTTGWREGRRCAPAAVSADSWYEGDGVDSAAGPATRSYDSGKTPCGYETHGRPS